MLGFWNFGHIYQITMIINFCDTTHHHLRLHHFSVLFKCLHRGNTDEKAAKIIGPLVKHGITEFQCRIYKCVF